MINTIRQFFEKNIKLTDKRPEKLSEHSLHVATAALLIEMMRSDASVSEAERKTITNIIRLKLALTTEEINKLLKLAEEELWKSTGYYEFTSLINKGFSYEEKIMVIEHLWEVAFTDAKVDKHEEHMVRKIADLLYVAHKDFIDAKLRVRNKKVVLQ
ncbi:MAG: TerB family tellurite resistance protein [Nitrospirota bacterium]